LHINKTKKQIITRIANSTKMDKKTRLHGEKKISLKIWLLTELKPPKCSIIFEDFWTPYLEGDFFITGKTC
jgi:hypothetical protein